MVDDEPACLALTVAILRRGGYECEEARDAHEAARMLEQKDYDLLISDLEMPGNEKMAFLHKAPKIKGGMPVILVTAYPTVESAVESIQLPVVAYLVKPFSAGKLLEEAGRAIENSRGLRMVKVNHERIAEWNRALEQVEKAMTLSRHQAPAQWQTLLDLTMRNVNDSITDLRFFTEYAMRNQPEGGPEGGVKPSEPLLLLNALRETIAVLEKTRSSFKSKDLGELRKKLELLIEGKRV